MRMKPLIASASLLTGLLVALPDTAAYAAPARYEAETSPAVCTGTIDSNWTGYSGSGFCNGNGAVGAYGQFTVNVSAAGTATLGIRFANGTTTARPANLIVNGSTVQTPSFEGTGAWSTWITKTVTVTLNAGANTIRLDPTTSGGLPNIDYLDVEATDPPTGNLPSSFRWSSSGALIAPKSDATHDIRAVKDPSVVYHDGRWHVFASTTNANGSYSMVYLNFTDWAQAGAAQHHYLDQTAIGTGYKAAPQVFYFAPQQRWYLVYQVGDNAAYSTTTDISNPGSWSAPQRFYAGGMPQIIRDNIGNGYWVDFWVICDSATCYLFSSDDNGHLYRSETTVANFPNGFTNTVIAMQDAARYPLWEAANVYKVSGSTSYLLVIEAIGSGGTRYFRSWTAPAITGPWQALANTEATPFAGAGNVTFSGTAWTRDISHGEMIRSGIDQTLTISPCNIRYLYQGKDPAATDPYNLLPWRLGLLTQTNSTC
ncbi:non-reducing end alpha-L-arabinofuranosidase family hydrolase [Nonomuraea sp. NEAU-A123]|uniref:non-reducing end alpha-L-arabinofuranosidase family hydrolase n=1 Tax=Nonomuraea sp. NEAU-A123 TaxID=2839649 RepID=UPI001BE4DB5A|nr:non-reducing end alpha-L-arabinofuranosidase family hydrolase [Nonomuraea sp. NEAU-A123]MBT2225038.1 carbohydrate-binding protein [Nonomuraea sp. NEAU-A123]